MRQISLAIEQRLHAAQIDLSIDEAHTLAYVVAYGPCPTGEVQRVLGLHRSTLTSLLARLVRRDLLSRAPAPTDKRVLLVQVTANGARLSARATELVLALEAAVLAAAPVGDAAAYDRLWAAVAATTGVTVVERLARPSVPADIIAQESSDGPHPV